jgi:hypothetical protein
MRTGLLIGLCVLISVSAAYLFGCRRYTGRYAKKADEGTAVAEKENKDDAFGGAEEKIRIDHHQLKGYWSTAEVGDWVKYIARVEIRKGDERHWKDCIEVRTITGFSGPYVEMERTYYDNGARNLRTQELSWDLLEREGEYKSLQEKKTEEIEGKQSVWDYEATFAGRKLSGDLRIDIISTVGQDEVGYVKGCAIDSHLIDFFSRNVKCGGLVYKESDFKRDYFLIDTGTTAESDRKDVKPGDLEKAVLVAELPEGIKTRAEKKAEIYLNAWKFKDVEDKKIPDVKDEFSETPEDILEMVDGLKSPYKGVRVGDWAKLLVQHHHVQIWTVQKIDNDSVYFRRRFYNNKGNIWSIDDATDELKSAEAAFDRQQKDPTYVVNKQRAIKLPTGKEIKGRLLIRRASMGMMARFLSSEQPVGEGQVFSKFQNTVYTMLLDWGDKDNVEGKVVKPGEVAKAKDLTSKWIKDYLPTLMPKEE